MKVLVIILLFTHAQALAEIRIQKNSIKETFTKNVEVSGSFLHGLQLHPNSNDRELYVYIPPKSGGKLCIDITAIDGRYRASMEHTLDETISGFTHIIFPTNFEEEMKLYEPKSLAVLASLKSNCLKRLTKRHLISSWSSIPNSTLNIYIRSSATHDLIDSENHGDIRCTKILGNKTISYDKMCQLDSFNYRSSGQIVIKRKNLQPIRSKKINYN